MITGTIQIGDIVRAIKGAPYTITTNGWIGKVILKYVTEVRVEACDELGVRVGIGNVYYDIDSKYLEPLSDIEIHIQRIKKEIGL